jgi:hypothetical protein
VDALVSVGEELFTTPTAFAAVAMVALVAELDLDIDGELDRMGSRGEPDDFVVDVDLGEDEPLELYDAVVGLGLFVEVLNAGRGLLDVEIGSGWGLLDVLALDLSGLSLSLLMGLAFRLGATTAAGSTTLGVLCYNGMKIKVRLPPALLSDVELMKQLRILSLQQYQRKRDHKSQMTLDFFLSIERV